MLHRVSDKCDSTAACGGTDEVQSNTGIAAEHNLHGLQQTNRLW